MQLVLSFGASEREASAAEPEVPHAAAPDEPAEGASRMTTGRARQDRDQPKRKRPNHPGRTALSPALERIITPLPVPAEQRLCVCCHHEMQVSRPSSTTSASSTYPRRWWCTSSGARSSRVVQSDCRGDITAAPRMSEARGRRRAGASLLAQLIEAKCDDGLPVERQRDQWLRLGFEVPANTLVHVLDARHLAARCRSPGSCSAWCSPRTSSASTTRRCRCSTRSARPASTKGTCGASRARAGWWRTPSPRAGVPTRSPRSWRAIDGFIQCDDYKGYSQRGHAARRPAACARRRPNNRLGCLMHVRRRFHEALKLGDKRAARGIELIAQLYDIERAAKEQALSADARLALRTERSLPAARRVRRVGRRAGATCLPSSPLGKALGYAHAPAPVSCGAASPTAASRSTTATPSASSESPAWAERTYLFTGSAEAAETARRRVHPRAVLQAPRLRRRATTSSTCSPSSTPAGPCDASPSSSPTAGRASTACSRRPARPTNSRVERCTDRV